MQSGNSGATKPRRLFWTGWVLTALPSGLLLFSAVGKFIQPKGAIENMEQHLGWPARLAVPLGVVEAACTLVYLVPRTAVLGAVLLTGYLGGAVAAHVRVGDAFIMPVLAGVLVWLGVFLRDARLRALLPLTKPV